MTKPRVSWLHPGYVVASGETAAPAVVVEEVRLRVAPKATAKAATNTKQYEPDADADTVPRDDEPEEYETAEEES